MFPRSSRIAFRTAARARYASTQSTAAAPPVHSSHYVAGLVGGGVTLGGLYGYYHYSGTAKVISQARTLADTAQQAKSNILSATPSPKQALALLRSAAHSYASAIPGASFAVDSSFDQLESLAESHGPQVTEIIKSTFADLKKAVEDGKGEKVGEEVMEKLMKAVAKMRSLAEEKGGDLFEKLVGDNEELKKILGDGGKDLQKLGEKYGPKAKDIATDAVNQSQKLIKSGGLNIETYNKIKELIAKKQKDITELAQKSGSDAWEASAKAATPFLSKIPDVKELVDSNVGSLKGLVGEDNVKIVKDLYAQLEKLAKSGKSPEDMAVEAKKIVEDKVGSLNELKKKAADVAGGATGGSASSLMTAASAIPGLSGLGKILGGEELSHLKEIAEKHGGDAEKLLESTYEEIKQVLKKKMDEAKKVAEKAKEDAKK